VSGVLIVTGMARALTNMAHVVRVPGHFRMSEIADCTCVLADPACHLPFPVVVPVSVMLAMVRVTGVVPMLIHC
jgi:hypothetical protein